MRTIFVSSTFADMQFERDILRDEVAPRINDLARQYNDHIEFCDLRWESIQKKWSLKMPPGKYWMYVWMRLIEPILR